LTTEPIESAKPLRWGIMGAARIARRRIVPALRETGARIVAVASKDKERAEDFAGTNGIERSYEGYDRLLDDPEIDVIYVPLENVHHYEWALKTAEARKACLCEKPLVLNARDARALKEAFGEAGGRLQEAFMWRHHDQIRWVSDLIAKGGIGEIRRVNATFSLTFDRPADNYRWSRDQGGGTLWDIGCYCVNASRFFFGGEPRSASCRADFLPGENGIDESGAGWLDFGEGRFATFSISFRTAFAQGIELLGTEGRAWIEKPWLQVGQKTRVSIELDQKTTVQEFEPMNAYATMIQHFTHAARNPDAALQSAEDGCLQAIAMEGLAESMENSGQVWEACG
jgi:D-xylose 1-dehydrogenase (NADP+, D-xylono-1,5-lactone-forming)